MKLTTIIKTTSLAVGFVTLAACSTMGAKSTASGANDTLGTTGLGTQSSVQGMNVSKALLLSAPHNQSYYFAFNKSMVHPKYFPSINAQATYLVSHPRSRILLAGNTDARGSHEYNIALGERRALAVASQLKLDGVNKNQIRVISYGDMKPIALGHTPAAYAKNRRVDLTYQVK